LATLGPPFTNKRKDRKREIGVGKKKREPGTTPLSYLKKWGGKIRGDARRGTIFQTIGGLPTSRVASTQRGRWWEKEKKKKKKGGWVLFKKRGW